MKSTSDIIYKNEITAEINKMLELPLEEILKRYGTEGWKLLIKRYMECTQ